jgi:ATP adenylyltransferase
MDYLWTPWRYQYLIGTAIPGECFFCAAAAAKTDEEHFVVHRARWNFVILNRYPYTSGHVMIAPYEHVGTLDSLAEDAAAEMMLLARRTERHLRAVYRPEGLNLGLNIGKCAGAGVVGHVHLHALPRWTGDSNFMTTIGETRVLPEDLPTTWRKLADAFRAGDAAAG